MSRTFTTRLTNRPDHSLPPLPECLSEHACIRVRRADPYQLTKEPCTYCQTNFGYDYYIQPPARNPPTLRRDG